ncbi:MAG: CRTAC1 family protein [Candidatus Latescibacterota bacterium]|nr:CRTAC1 family protein [Candidatus Latescibacterota bacterium]
MIRFSFILFALALTGCTSEPYQAPGTTRMATRLAALVEGSNPADNIYLSAQRVTWLRDRPEPEGAVQKLSQQIELAKELLQAGESAEAARLFQTVRSQAGSNRLRTRPSLEEMLGLSYLRLGEQQNCIDGHNIASCLFPITAQGVHKNQQGSRSAIQFYSEVLRQSPFDMTSRWLLNIAYMTVGEYPTAVPDKWLIPPEVFAADYDLGHFPDRAPALGLDALGLAGGGIMEDFDNDGFNDIIASSWGLKDQLRYFRNQGDGTFADITKEAGLTGIVGGLNAVQTDYDNDGFADVLVLRGGWFGADGLHPNSLLHNQGNGTFADVTEKAGLLTLHPTQTAAWADFDNDGHLDLFFGNESSPGLNHPCELFRNNGDGTFTDIAAEVGLDVQGFIKGVAWGDIDNDRFPELYITRLGAPNLLFHNDGPDAGGNWHFSDITTSAGVGQPTFSFPIWFWDYDNDGFLDLFVSGYKADAGDVAADYLGLPHKGEPPRLYRNQGDGTFLDVAAQTQSDKVLFTMGCNFGDLDNDGWLDFYAGTGDPDYRSLMPNRMFRNAGGQLFQDVTTSGGFGHLQKGHGVAFGDLDNDGDQDIYAVLGGAYSGDVFTNMLFENPGHGNHWLTLQLQGVQSNRAGIGARIQVEVPMATSRRTIHVTAGTGASFGASTLQQEIGLGAAQAISQLIIHWPSGVIQTFGEVQVDRKYVVREDASALEAVALQPLALGQTGGGHPH